LKRGAARRRAQFHSARDPAADPETGFQIEPM
jgi:hypothetical protein